MGASSVTGKGTGNSFPGNKGPRNGRQILTTLEVLAAGSVTLAPASPVGTETVTFAEALEYGSSSYAVILTSDDSTSPYTDNRTNNSDGKFISFDIAGQGDVDWIVVKKGFAS